jgi:type IV pilus assembly protein PilM
LPKYAKNSIIILINIKHTLITFLNMFSDKNIIGLDIGSESIKIVEITHHEDHRELLTYGVAKHSIPLDGYWDSSRLRKLSTIIEDILDTGNFKGIKTVMSKDVYVTTMDFEESWDKKTIQAEIDKQSSYFLPYPPDEMRLSWNLIEDDKRVITYTGKQRAIINALPDFVIENSKNLLEHLNLDGAALENQTRSQMRSALEPDNGKTVLIDIGDKFTTLSIVVDGTLRSSMHINSGVQKIEQNLSLSLGIDEEAAHNFKKDLGLVNLYQVSPQIMDILKTLKNEMTTFVDLNKKIAQDPDKIVITGGGVHTPGLYEFFRDYPIPVYIANPMRSITVSQTLMPYVAPVGNQLSTAIGLALRGDI